MQPRSLLRLGAALVAAATMPSQAMASYAFYVGKNLTQEGGVLVGGTGEEVSSHWLALVPARRHASGETLEVGITEEARIPGQRFAIPQARATHRYLSMFYSDFEGFPPPLTNGGLNHHQVAVRDVWAPCREELVAMTPTPQKGLSYSDLARLVLERAQTARQGVELIGRLIAKHGYATYGGNTHLIADPNEAWVVWEMAGGQGLWAAERLGPAEVRVLYPGYIEDFPPGHEHSPDHMGAPHLVDFAEARGWYRPDSGEPFDLWKVYGRQGARARTGGFKLVTPATLEQELRELAPLSEQDLMRLVRDPRLADDEAGYGFVAALRRGVPVPLVRAWIAPTGALAAPFLPWWIGVARIPLEYRQHRYLTRDAASTFLHPDYQLQEATPFVGRVFKRVLYYTCARPADYLPKVRSMLERFERTSARQLRWVESAARTLFARRKRKEAHALLTFYANSRARSALELGHDLGRFLHTDLDLRGEFKAPKSRTINRTGSGETVNCLPGRDPDRPPEPARPRPRRSPNPAPSGRP